MNPPMHLGIHTGLGDEKYSILLETGVVPRPGAGCVKAIFPVNELERAGACFNS